MAWTVWQVTKDKDRLIYRSYGNKDYAKQVAKALSTGFWGRKGWTAEVRRKK